MKDSRVREWFAWKLYYWRCELIYALGGTPNAHQNTIHYRNIETVVKNIREQIEKAEKPN